MDAAPYDNVEFPPARKPGTGTWPGPGGAQSQSQSTSIKTSYTQQTSVNKDKSGAKLAPLMESMEVAETEDQRMQAKVYQAASHGTHSSHSSSSSVRSFMFVCTAAVLHLASNAVPKSESNVNGYNVGLQCMLI